jgi:hypothetical protein
MCYWYRTWCSKSIKVTIMVFWVMAPCSMWQNIILEDNATSNFTWRWRYHRLPKPLYPVTQLYGVIIQKTTIWIFIAVNSSLASINIFPPLYIMLYIKFHRCQHILKSFTEKSTSYFQITDTMWAVCCTSFLTISVCMTTVRNITVQTSHIFSF